MAHEVEEEIGRELSDREAAVDEKFTPKKETPMDGAVGRLRCF